MNLGRLSYTMGKMTTSSRTLIAALMLAPAAFAFCSCGSDSTSNQPYTTAPDAAGGSAGTGGGGQDAQPEASPEAAPEASPDVVQEPGPDAPVVPDAPPEAQPEPEPEAGPEAEAGPGWPTCDAKPSGVPDTTISAIWAQNPAAATHVWVAGVYVTAISKNGCVDGSTCQIFLQDAETYASYAASAHHGIKMLVSAATAKHFTSIKVGDKVDVEAHAWRYNVSPPANELLLQVNAQLPGCAKAVGSGVPAPVTGVQLSDLSVDGYENTHGPVLIQVAAVSGKPGFDNQIFALWNTAGPYVDSGIENVVNVSPYFLANGAFTGLPTDGATTVKFTTITGVFGLFVPSSVDGGTVPKYMVLYPRTMADVVKAN